MRPSLSPRLTPPPPPSSLAWPHLNKRADADKGLMMRRLSHANPLAKMMSCSTLISRPKRNNNIFRLNFTLFSSILLLLLVSLVRAVPEVHQKFGQPTAATNAYGEPIKWSFGGWAPLDGQQPVAKRNQSGSTTPLPPVDPSNPHRTTAAAQHPTGKHHQQQLNNRTAPKGWRQGGDSMNVSASNAHGKVQFVAPQMPESQQQQPGARSQGNELTARATNQQQQHQIHSGPAYALSMPRPTHFSPPAPMPIIREHLLPAAAGYLQQGQTRGSLGPHHMPNHHQQQQRMQQHRQQESQMIAAHQYPRHPVSMHEHQRRLEHQHRQQMMRHHHLMMQHQQHRQPNHQMMQQQQYQQGQEAKMSGARFAQPAPMIEGYRVVEGEHPILFTPPAGMMEAAANYTNQQAASQAPYASTMAANEKDNLNYQNALRQVASSSYESQQSNNIQDIKQKQQLQQQADKQQENNKPGPYLTIPVAVETEGDKVLTADDINEIEKHVIQVLPNLKTADKVVKLADTKLTLASANLKDAAAIQQIANTAAAAGASLGPTTMHQLNYEEHRSTIKQLENDMTPDNKQQYGHQYDSATTAMPSTPSSSAAAYNGQHSQQQQHSTPVLNQATTNAHVHHQKPKSIDDGQQQPQQELAEHQYFLATGPMQEVGTVDPEQLAEYNLIKNDLLNLRYEPTRASSGAQHNRQQQTASTPPMPYTVSQPTPQHKPASVTRYFQQGNQMYQQHHLEPSGRPTGQRNNNNNNLFGRIQTPATRAYAQQQQQPSASTKTILGGRRVSEVMRNLIHTTPVPMTSPMHVPSVEPEKLDAIQLIASHGNDNKPMVVEPHQLVQHTPEGGFDYNSGGMNINPSSNNNTGVQQQYGQQNGNSDGQQLQYGPPAAHFMEQQHNGGDGQQPGGAIIEYVAVGEQALNNALGAAQHEGTYEIANQPEVQPVYLNGEEQQQNRQQQETNPSDGSSRAPFVYDYTMSADQQNTASPGGSTVSEQSGPTTYSMSPSSMQHQHEQQQQQIQQGGEPPMFTWSPSIANEHQQQQAELNEHAAPGHQMDMPATAGYNFFGQSGEQQPSKETGQGYEQQPQQQYQEEPQQNGKWRSKAGGSQPNPDAQYDGQIVKGASDHESNHDEAPNSQQSADEQQQQYSSPAEGGHRGQATTRLTENQGDSGADGYQQKQTQQGYQQQQQESPTTTANQQVGEGYLATNSYAAGAQFNHQTPSHGNFDQQQEYDQSRQQPSRYNYVKLDHDRQQAHLAQQQAQRQAQVAEIMNNQQQIYQTTTPISLTTMASADAQQQHHHTGEDPTQQQQQRLSDYGQDQSLPSVQSSPDSMLINESPVSMPILDQQSLISDPNQDSNHELSSDDGAKQTQPAAVYQVYQAYYAPKDHKPLPGYVRLSLEEFNELFRDAEIQYVDKNNLNNIAPGANNRQNPSQGGQDGQHAYEQSSGAIQNDLMKASASEQNQSIVVDRRSITPERRSSNATASDSENSENLSNSRKLKFGGAVKKIISIRNSRQAARQQLLKTTILKHKAQHQQKLKKPNINAASSTTSPSFSPPTSTASNNHPSTKQQQPNVSKSASNTQSKKSVNEQQIATNKRKSDESPVVASSVKKSSIVAQSHPAKVAAAATPAAAAATKASKQIEKPKLSLSDGVKRTTTNDMSGSKATH